MSPKLTKININNVSSEKLTSRIHRPFVISLKYELLDGYKLTNMSIQDIKHFQSFLDKVTKMTFQQVDTVYKRKSDKQDKYISSGIIHYEYSDGCRVHGIIEEGRFKLLRIDPNHRVHQ